LILLLVLDAGHSALAADDGTTHFPDYISQTLIDGNALNGANGVVSINVASGDMNLQANGTSLAINLDAQRGRGISSAGVTVLQRVKPLAYAPPDSALAAIEGSAFQNASGLISVNQASGVANRQANEVAIMLGIAGEAVSEDVLSETFSDATREGVELNPSGVRQVSIADTSFQGARGVAQVTQSAGSWNTTTNSFVLNITAGTSVQ